VVEVVADVHDLDIGAQLSMLSTRSASAKPPTPAARSAKNAGWNN
jgi:hypothetical protein